jgi:predicted tellurium resistance membrane protein TerC
MDISFATWAVLGGLIAVMAAFDLLVYGRGRTPSMRANSLWSLGWIGVALAFGVGFWLWQGSEAGSEFFAGYLIERTLSIDNLFVFAVVLGALSLTDQAKALSWGIGLALVLRLGFILVGAALLDAFHFTFYVFGALLLYTAFKLARHSDGFDPRKLLNRLNARNVSPFVAVFLVIAVTDVIFAVDSIPAIFAITKEPFIVFAANAFALIGLRSLYFLLVGLMDRFVYLSQGLAIILAFIGAKMLLIDVWHVPIALSLSVIVGVLAATALLSMRAERSARARACTADPTPHAVEAPRGS